MSTSSAKKTEPIIQVSTVKYLKNYELKIEFSDGKSQLIDFKPFLKNSQNPEIQKYLKISHFKKFKLLEGELMWGDYDLLFPIMDLYYNRIYPNLKIDTRQSS